MYVPVITSHASPPSAAVAALPEAGPANRATGGTRYTSARPITVPRRSSGLCRSCAYALRETMRHRSCSRGYGRTLSTRSASPSQM